MLRGCWHLPLSSREWKWKSSNSGLLKPKNPWKLPINSGSFLDIVFSRVRSVCCSRMTNERLSSIICVISNMIEDFGLQRNILELLFILPLVKPVLSAGASASRCIVEVELCSRFYLFISFKLHLNFFQNLSQLKNLASVSVSFIVSDSWLDTACPDVFLRFLPDFAVNWS